MATAELDARKQTILDALKAAVERQASSDLKQMDLVAIAVAVESSKWIKSGLSLERG